MSVTPSRSDMLDQGQLSFSVEGRILRELGERLVKNPEVAILELVKNAYDADAATCAIELDEHEVLRIVDDGHGMTLEKFRNSWMRVGTSSKEGTPESPKFERAITGEKGIGRFAVRFLGRKLRLKTVAFDSVRGERTLLEVEFNWPNVDLNEDLGKATVPYRLQSAGDNARLGTTLEISSPRVNLSQIDWRRVRTGAIGIVSPLRSLFESTGYTSNTPNSTDPGFELRILAGDGAESESDLASQILENFVLRANLKLSKRRLKIQVYEKDSLLPFLEIDDAYENSLGNVSAELRFFPRRPGTFDEAPVDGRRAYTWIKENSGVAVFDRSFRVLPYGTENDDWLQLSADAARNYREPRSSVAKKHFPMAAQVRSSTQENWMLRLPQSAQIVGLVRVRGARAIDDAVDGLIASADREGFVENQAFDQLYDLIRGAAECIAVADRMIQRRDAEKKEAETIESARQQTAEAIAEIEQIADLPSAQKKRIVNMLVESQKRIERQETQSSQRQNQLEAMSLLGIIAGYMTHEFGVALTDLDGARLDLENLAEKSEKFKKISVDFGARVARLKEFSKYSRAYIEGTRRLSSKPFKVRTQINHVLKLLSAYSDERGVKVDVGVEASLISPTVPAALYNGIVQNLFTNALKAVSARRGACQMTIALRAWNDNKWHYLQVSDTGIGIPSALEDLVFDPLFSTTDMNSDPLGSGMGLGLSLVRRGTEAFGGKVTLVTPPAGFATCVEVKLPRAVESSENA